MPFPHASQALSGFTVLDLTRVRSGPTCVRQLADWGANVIKIDALTEEARRPQLFLNEPNSGLFQSSSIAVDGCTRDSRGYRYELSIKAI